MVAVGVRELKNRLSEYLRRVRQGETVLVTDRGTVVAQLTPPGDIRALQDLPPALGDLAKRGLASLGGPNDASRYPIMPHRLRGTTVRQLLDEGRGER
jgi:prevent-host-death family protein